VSLDTPYHSVCPTMSGQAGRASFVSNSQVVVSPQNFASHGTRGGGIPSLPRCLRTSICKNLVLVTTLFWRQHFASFLASFQNHVLVTPWGSSRAERASGTKNYDTPENGGFFTHLVNLRGYPPYFEVAKSFFCTGSPWFSKLGMGSIFKTQKMGCVYLLIHSRTMNSALFTTHCPFIGFFIAHCILIHGLHWTS